MRVTAGGKSRTYKTAKAVQLRQGKNTQFEGDAVVAGCDGRFEYNNSEFWINEVLEIASDAEYRTDHIDFPGDVIIRGEIQDGFKQKPADVPVPPVFAHERISMLQGIGL